MAPNGPRPIERPTRAEPCPDEEKAMDSTLLERLRISPAHVEEVNALLLDPSLAVMHDFLEVVGKYGTPEEINRRAEEARQMSRLLERVKQTQPQHLEHLDWLTEQRDRKAFITIDEYRRQSLGGRAAPRGFQDDFAVTLEGSACQYF